MGSAKRDGSRSRRKESIERRESKVHLADFASMPADFSWYASLKTMIPSILRGRDLEDLAERIARARREERPVIVMMGAHVVKCGLGALLCSLLKRRIVTRIAMNGACAIHDVEIAMWGKTSEDVGEGLKSGLFGETEETARFFAAATRAAFGDRIGLGKSLGNALRASEAPNAGASILATARETGVPVTVHVALGTDVVHQHSEADGAAIGFATMEDFKDFSSAIAALRGGVILNLGSAVILPEVFLKALAMARNAGADLGQFTTANFDMIPLYRPTMNIVERPRLVGATTYSFNGNHEILLPVLVASIMSRL